MSRTVFKRISSAFLLTLGLALAVRAFVPTGWMIFKGEQGAPVLGWCSAHGGLWDPETKSYQLASKSVPGLPPLHQGNDGPDESDVAAFTCPFSLANLALDTTGPLPTLEPAVYVETISERPPARAPPVLRILTTPVSPRAPPLPV